MINWKVEKRKVSELVLWDKNPRTITEEAYERLKGRIKERGFHDVLKIDTDNTILSGNQRKRALEELGIKEVDVKVPERKLTDTERDKVALESNIFDGKFSYDDLANNFEIETLEEINLPNLDKILGEDIDSDIEEKGKTKCPKCGHEF